jgi:DNA-binding Xre family transcriptional regulator
MARKPAPPTFGATLARLRKEKGMSCYRLAKLTGLATHAVVLIERGADVKWSTVLKLCSALGVTPNDFYHPGPKPTNKENRS